MLKTCLHNNLLLQASLYRNKNETKRFCQVDLCAEEMGNNVKAHVALLGDVGAVVCQV